MKGINNNKKWNIVYVSSKGFIEQVDGSTSFNVFSGVHTTRNYKFYKSAYDIESAKSKLYELHE